ncbi:MAG: PAS domain S-box protein [Oligoflexia bacterium]|nr:PAS domain S-box protein [Oligoflexia bacterium]
MEENIKSTSETPLHQSASVRVLLIEDNQISAKRSHLQISKLGYNVFVVEKESDAKEKIEEVYSNIEHLDSGENSAWNHGSFADVGSVSGSDKDDEAEAARTRASRAEDAIPFDVIIKKLNIQGQNKDPFIHYIKTNSNMKIRSVPIIVMTMLGSDEKISDLTTCGADDFVGHPFRADEIGLRIRNLLETKLAHEESAVQLRAIENSMEGMAIIKMSTGTITYLNRAFFTMLGYESKAEVIGKNWLEIFRKEDRGELKMMLRDLASKKIVAKEMMGVMKSGQLFHQEISLNKLDLSRFVLECRNIDSRKKSEKFIDLLINSLGQGLLVFDQGGRCFGKFTQVCVDLFGTSPENKFIWHILSLPEVDHDGCKRWISALFEQKIPFKDLAKLGPSSIKRGDCFIALNYYAIYEEDKKISAVVLVATDKTAEENAKENAKKTQCYADLILNLAKNKKQFLFYTKETKVLFSNITDMIENSIKKRRHHAADFIEEINPEIEHELKMINRLLHTIKGGAAAYSFSKLQQLTHDCESTIKKYISAKQGISENFWTKLRSDVAYMRSTFNGSLQDLSGLLGESAADGHFRVEIPIQQIHTFSTELKTLLGKEHKTVLRFTEVFAKTPIITYFKGYNYLIQKHAEYRTKKVEEIIFQGGDIRIDEAFYAEFFMVLEHIFLNIVDHGIEVPQERTAKGKSASGRVQVVFSKQEYQEAMSLKIIIQDDGGGIDPRKVRDKLKANGVAAEKIENDDVEVIQHIFDDAFSTAEKISITSGRGIGLAAVKGVIEKLGGGIVVNSVLNKGCRFTILLPFV